MTLLFRALAAIALFTTLSAAQAAPCQESLPTPPGHKGSGCKVKPLVMPDIPALPEMFEPLTYDITVTQGHPGGEAPPVVHTFALSTVDTTSHTFSETKRTPYVDTCLTEDGKTVCTWTSVETGFWLTLWPVAFSDGVKTTLHMELRDLLSLASVTSADLPQVRVPTVRESHLENTLELADGVEQSMHFGEVSIRILMHRPHQGAAASRLP